jgi:transcription elongation factor Elf1
MVDLRDMTPDEAEKRRHVSHERRAADEFMCPRCGTWSGMSASTPDTAVIKCHGCGRDYFAWTVPGTIHVTAKTD